MALTVGLAAGRSYEPLYERLPQFELETGIPVVVQAQPSPDDLHSQIAFNPGAYDLVSCHSRLVTAWSEWLLPLDEWLSADELADFTPAALEQGRVAGRLAMLPRALEARLLYYRADLLENDRESRWYQEATGQALHLPQTWEELALVAQYFARESRAGFAFPGLGAGLLNTFQEIHASLGGTFIDDRGRPRFADRAGEWALGFLRDLHHRWQATPPETLHMDEQDVSDFFRSGRAALCLDQPGSFRYLRDTSFSAVAGYLRVALPPAGTRGRRRIMTGCAGFGVIAGSAQQDEALALLRFLTSVESQRVEMAEGHVPPRESLRAEAVAAARPGTIAHLRWSLLEPALTDLAITPPRLADWPELEAALVLLFQQALSGELEVRDALRAGSREVEDRLRRR